MANVYVNKDGIWNKIRCPYVNVDGVWCVVRSVYVRTPTEWKKVWQFEAEILTLPVNFNKRQEIQDVCACAA